MSADLGEARRRWREDAPKFASFGKAIEAALKAAVLASGIHPETTSRPKDLPSLIKKLIVKGDHLTYDTLPDRCGARCVVRYRHECAPVLQIARELFDCREVEDKGGKMKPNVVGYQSIHVDVRFREGDARAVDFPPEKFWAELQIRTMGQHLWSEMSHDTFYKNATLISSIAPGTERRINLMAGLIEVADVEFERLARETDNPVVAVLAALERLYYRFSDQGSDVEVSLQAIPALIRTYDGATTDAIVHRVEEFVNAHEEHIRDLFQSADPETTNPLLWQPESLMFYERLDHDENRAQRALVDVLPETEVNDLALLFGVSFSS